MTGDQHVVGIRFRHARRHRADASLGDELHAAAPPRLWLWSCSARARYAVVTPKRPDATCLMRLSARSLPSSGVYVAGSSPPSPELERAWMRFMAIASVACASGDSAPSDIALEMKRRRIAST